MAIDLRRVRLFSVAGTDEPRSLVPESRSYVRTGLVPEAQRRGLLAAFNGGQGTINVNSWAPDSGHIAYVAYPMRDNT